MLPAKHILPPDWMTDHKCVKIMRVLGGYETPAQALFVGGCVRNTLLEKPVRDIDIATLHPPMIVMEKLKAAGVRFIPTGLEHGTVTAVIDDSKFEITTLRKDIDTNGRHAVIAFTTKWEEDADRRDFTINTLLSSPEGHVYDPTGMGLSDLDVRHIRFVGNPPERIAEDYLRILRFFRFFAEYGEGEPDTDALKACEDHAGKISSLSRERITQEFLKILGVPAPAPHLALMFSRNVLKPMGKNFKRETFESLCALQARNDAYDVMTRLFAMAGMRPTYFEDFLVLSNAQKKHLEMLGQGLALLGSVTKKKIRELVYRVGNQMTVQTYLTKLAEKDKAPDLEILDLARYWQAPEFPVKAEELIAKGISPGPALGKTLKALEDRWIAKDFPAVFKYKV